MNVLTNEIELNLIYSYEKQPINSLDYGKNLAYKLGVSNFKDNYFDTELTQLVNAGILSKVYDIDDNGYREGLYNFTQENAQISFEGRSHMGLSISYCY